MERLVIWILIMLCVSGCGNNDRNGMEIYSSITSSFNNGYTENITVILNRREIDDFEECAKEIVQCCIDNDFVNIKFAYDFRGYPNAIDARVYLSEKDVQSGNVAFRMVYEVKGEQAFEYNIKDNPEKFSLELK